MKSRRIVGGHEGPICGNLQCSSVGGYHQTMAFSQAITDQPRFHGGCDSRQLQEVWQCHVGTILMLTTIKILTWIYAYGGSVTLEHPRGDSESSEKWSIWRSGFLRQLLLVADAQAHNLLTGTTWTKFSKACNAFCGTTT